MKASITNEVAYSVKVGITSSYKVATNESFYNVKDSYKSLYKVTLTSSPFVVAKPINQ